MQTLETLLRNPPRSQEQYDRIRDVANTIVRKIGYTEKVAAVDRWEFLMAFYARQRGFLENRHLFGDSRQDTFHDRDEKQQRPAGCRPPASAAPKPPDRN